MRSESEILADIEKAVGEYNEVTDTESLPKLRKRTEDVKVLREELAAFYAAGAEPCPDCDIPPHGMRKNPWTYEIGCLGCSSRVRASGREEAVALWNQGQRLPPAG